jgi:integrase
MAKLLELYLLTARQVETVTAPGYHRDGGGLFLQVAESAGGTISKSWIFKYAFNGRTREMGLGSCTTVSLKGAREKAGECRGQLQDGVDPISARDARRKQEALEAAATKSWNEVKDEFFAVRLRGWRETKHGRQWHSTLATYVDPHIGDKPVSVIDVNDIYEVLLPIWFEKNETARRVRERIERILSFATARKYRSGPNPAVWRGNLSELLPKPSEIQKAEHHPALPYEEVPAFVAELRKHKGLTPLALEFLILTVPRVGSLITAQAKEFADGVWTAPAEHMKGRKSEKREQRTPLCPRAQEIIDQVLPSNPEALVFPLSDMAMTELIRDMRKPDRSLWRDKQNGRVAVPHGFRSTFKDWASDLTLHQDMVIEMALAHTVEGDVEAAYRRRDLFLKRQWLMNDWGRYCCTGQKPELSPELMLLHRLELGSRGGPFPTDHALP